MTGESQVVTLGPEAAGDLLGQTANWMLEKARAGKIPYTRIGRKIRFTPQHVAEIARMFEQRPQQATLAARTPARRKTATAEVPAVLEARTPRRKMRGAA